MKYYILKNSMCVKYLQTALNDVHGPFATTGQLNASVGLLGLQAAVCSSLLHSTTKTVTNT